MTDDHRALDADPVEDGERVDREVGGRVALRGAPTLAVPARVRRDELESPRDRIREEIPVASVVPDAVQEQRRRRRARPGPVHEFDAFARDRGPYRHKPRFSLSTDLVRA